MSLEVEEISYRLPVSREMIALVIRDESPDVVYFIDLFSGGVLSLRRPSDWDWEGIGEGFDHSVECGFRRTPERFLGVDRLSPGRKRAVIEKFAELVADEVLRRRVLQAAGTDAPFADVAEALGGRPAELCAWRTHLEGATAEAAAKFLEDNGISTEPAPSPELHQGRDASLFVN